MTEPPVERYSLRPGVYTATRDGTRYLLTRRKGGAAGPASPATDALLSRLASGPVTVAELQSAGDGDPVGPLLTRWREDGWLCVTVERRQGPCYTVRPFRAPPVADRRRPGTLVLSRFTMIHRVGPELLVESPLAWCDIAVHDVSLLAAVLNGAPGPRGGAADRLTDDLWRAGMLVPPGAEQNDVPEPAWCPHELWFHHRSRISDRLTLEEPYAGSHGGGHHRGSHGGGHHPGADGADDRPGPPATPSRAGGAGLPLPRPDLDHLRASDPPLAAVMEDRRSLRDYDRSRQLSVTQLGELLFRCARTDAAGDDAGEPVPARRPYPVAGGLYDLELYPVVAHVDGLPPGMYRYDPDAHGLAYVSEPNRATRALLASAGEVGGLREAPPLLVVISARFPRVMSKYRQLAYALMLKNVGVLYQQLYLASTAMGLAPCALGSGDVDAFAEATGCDPLWETSVGEFVIGEGPDS